MTPRRLDDLLVRYWADALTAAEAGELDELLAADPDAAAVFEAYCVQTLAVRDWAAVGPPPAPVGRRPSRRGWLAGLAAGVVAAAVPVARFVRPDEIAGGAVLVRWTGTVRVTAAAVARPAEAGEMIPAGQTVSTVGLDASAVLSYPDGTAVVLSGDTVATLEPADRGERLTVRRGAVSAVVASVPTDGRFTVASAEGRVVADGGTNLSLCRTADRTEVGLLQGGARLTDPAGDRLTDMAPGDVVTVDAAGRTFKEAWRDIPTSYSWDLDGPLPAGWELGRRVADPTARPFAHAAVPTLWDDPYIRRTCWQVRSNSRWVKGLFAVHADSRFRVRYKVDRAGAGQLLLVVRYETAARGYCNVLLAPVEFAPTADGGWRTVELAAADWEREDKPDRPPLGDPPWMVFLVVFNTYERDLGLRVAEFAAGRGGLPPAGE